METSNPELQLANDFVCDTHLNIFLTGKAGTGKTTFLHQLKENSPKRMIITAPTGVAAMNAGGVTLHSFFQLPFAPFIPGREPEQRRFSQQKINIIKSLDLLVIDEISMVRSDMLDSVDDVLRRYKNRDLPFGGVQLLMIGDLHQLSPVVKDDEWAMLKEYYSSCYFFSSNALQQTERVTIELRHIYRQSDQAFIHLLNCVRDNQLDHDTLETLNSRYLPDFSTNQHENYITLTTHNRNADSINHTRLQEVDAPLLTFQAVVEKNYPDYIFPTAEQLQLKKGAQVMFVRNDLSPEKLYFNGKIGKITRIDGKVVRVKCPEDEAEIIVEPVTWENIKYTIDAGSKKISEEVVGTFRQHPLRLAWAITIHKSQGLTFERAIIDANSAFSHGQVYVALSRCKTFEGLVLSTPISSRAVKTDRTVAQFVMHENENSPTQTQLDEAKILYQQNLLLACFDFQLMQMNLAKLIRLLLSNQHLIQYSGLENLEDLRARTFNDVTDVGEKFKRQLQSLFNEGFPEDNEPLQERVQKASHYFTEKLEQGLADWLSRFRFNTDNKNIRKQVNKADEALQHVLRLKIAVLYSCRKSFSIEGYLNAQAKAEIEGNIKSSNKAKNNDIEIADIEHLKLFHRLREWRSKQATEEEVEHYRVLHQSVLIHIATMLPDTFDSLLKIKGMGSRLVDRYGLKLTTIVSDFCRENNVQPQREMPKPKAVTTETKQASFDLHRQGKSVREISKMRGFVESTIEGHLAHFIGLGQLDISEVVSHKKVVEISQAIEVEGADKGVKIIKDRLGDSYSYGEIKMVIEMLKIAQSST